jgi:transcriptional regulator with XRE-family HTH domain
MSQERLAELLGITYQQVQKYERGANRIGSSRLHDIARFLEVPVAWFFEGADGKGARPRGLAEDAPGFAFDAPPQGFGPDVTFSREALELLRAFNQIGNPGVRRRLCELTKSLAEVPWTRSTRPRDA